MEFKTLGHSELTVSTVSVGCMNFGSMCDQATTDAIDAAALDSGVNFFDVADIYGGPQAKSETLLGKAPNGAGVASNPPLRRRPGNRRGLPKMRFILPIRLDEPTASMDAAAEAELFDYFKAHTEGRISILISHRFSTVRHADRIAVIEHGRISEYGTHQKLLERNGLSAKLFRLQAEGYR
jgi:hypothetical protein